MENSYSRRLGPFGLAAALTAAVALSGCGDQTGPRGVMTKSIHAMMDGNYSVQCSYETPDESDGCAAGLLIESPTMSGSIKLGTVAQDNDQAIGVLLGHVCETFNDMTVCGSNSNPDLGLPRGSESFADAYQADNNQGIGQSAAERNFWIFEAIKQNGRWYVDLGD